MFYDFAFTITKGTTKAAPEEAELHLTHGVIHTVRFDFPPGPRGEVDVVLYHEEHQLYPTNPDGSFNADNTYINYDDFFELTTEPYSLKARGWAPDADYDHTVHIEIGVMESKLAMAMIKLATGMEKFLKMVGIKV